MPGISFLLSVFPCLEDSMLPPVGHCNIHHKVKLFSVMGCLLTALVLNHSPCINTAYENHLILGCLGSGFIFPPGRAPGSPLFPLLPSHLCEPHSGQGDQHGTVRRK